MTTPVAVTRVKSRTEVLPVSLQEAKRHLQILSDHDDERVADALKAAVEYAEDYQRRSLRTSTVIIEEYRALPMLVRFEVNPVISVDSITYRTSDGALAELSPDAYSLILSTDGMAEMVIGEAPSDLGGNVQIEYTAGYAVDIPETCRQAILMLTSFYFGNLDDRQARVTRERSRDLLMMKFSGNYS